MCPAEFLTSAQAQYGPVGAFLYLVHPFQVYHFWTLFGGISTLWPCSMYCHGALSFAEHDSEKCRGMKVCWVDTQSPWQCKLCMNSRILVIMYVQLSRDALPEISCHLHCSLQKLWMTVILVSFIMIREYFWVTQLMCAIGQLKPQWQDVEKETRHLKGSYDRKFHIRTNKARILDNLCRNSMSELLKWGYTLHGKRTHKWPWLQCAQLK